MTEPAVERSSEFPDSAADIVFGGAGPGPSVERLRPSVTPVSRAIMLTVGVAATTGLSVLTGHALGYQLRASVLFALPLGVVVGVLFAVLLILRPARAQARHLTEMASRIDRVAKFDRSAGFDDLICLEDEHELMVIARAVHTALATAHADRLEAARLRREMDARVEQQTRANTAQLARLSTTDELTGLVNRRGLDQFLRAAYSAMADGGPEFALVAIDLDHFKRLNDTCGHEKGDLALQAAAEIMEAGIRAGDLAARAGGDELFLVLRAIKPEQAIVIASRIADLYSRHPEGNGLPWPTMSMGVAMARRHRARSPEHLRQLADAALYHGKRAGRSRCVMYSQEMQLRAAA